MCTAVEVTLEMAQTSLESRVEALEDRVDKLESKIDTTTPSRTESDMATFLNEKAPGTHVEQVTALGYYLVHIRGEESFTISDIQEAYDRCRLPDPANMSDVLAGAEDNGWLKRTGTHGRKQLWTVTPGGDKAVEGGFD